MVVSARRVAILMIACLVGCNAEPKPRPLTPGAFTSKTNAEPLSRADQPGELTRRTNVPELQPQVPDNGVSAIVRENVKPAGPVDDVAVATTQQASTAPSTGPTTIGVSTGSYYQVGGIVMEVGGTPIFANKVVMLAEPVFAARAKELDEQQFRAFAQLEVRKQVAELRDLQLEYNKAERHLDQKDKEQADVLTMAWKQRQIAAAGGSPTVARQRAAARGENFEELAQEQYRTFLTQLYYHRKIYPRVQVSADEIRTYYQRNRDREFTDHGGARFRLIKLDVQKRGGPEATLRFANELRNRIAKAGEPFESIARSVNDDPRLLKSGGDLGTVIQKGAFAIAPVDEAVWKTEPGQVTEVIQTPGACYIALVEEKKAGKVLPFDEETQTKIEYQLKNEIFRKERQAERERLIKEASVRSSLEMLNIAVDMAMQNYPRWAGKSH